jgi:hypothetical protein
MINLERDEADEDDDQAEDYDYTDDSRENRLGSKRCKSKQTIDSTLEKFKLRIFSPDKGKSDKSVNDGVTNQYSRSLEVEVDPENLRSTIISNQSLCKSGPPLLPDNVSVTKFFEWQDNILRFISYLPGYIPGMLLTRPSWRNLSDGKKEYIVKIYSSIHGWLAKAVCNNTKVMVKTKMCL